MSGDNTKRVEDVLKSLGYAKPVRVEGRTSIADLIKKRQRCGVYVLGFKNGEVYGGQAVDVARRYSQHSKTHNDIVDLYFTPLPRRDLNEFEQKVIRTLELRGLATRNITFSSTIEGETDLDDVMPVALQTKFEESASFNDAGGRRTNDEDVRRKLVRRFEKFVRRPHAEEVMTLLRAYIPTCIPAFIRTELSFWEVSLPPRPPWVYARVSVAWQEVVTALEEEDGSLWFSFHVAASPLGVFGKSNAARNRVAASLDMEAFDHQYKWGGPDQVNLVAPSKLAMTALRDDRFRRAARLFNLRLMRKSPTPYGKFHCFALADALLGPSKATDAHVEGGGSMESLTMNIKREFFAAIVAGRKRIEYRRMSPFWKRRIEPLSAPFRLRLLNGMTHPVPEAKVVVSKVTRHRGEYYLHLAKVLAVKHWNRQSEEPKA